MRIVPFWRGRSAQGRLRLLVLAVSDRCDARCCHCSIWRGTPHPGLTLAERMAVVDEAVALGIESALLTGGEPLLSPHVWPLAESLRKAGVRVLVATTGFGLRSQAPKVAELVDEVYVSVDGASAATHDAVRGVAGFARMAAGVAAVRALAPRVTLVARATLHGKNVGEVEGIVEAARRLGFHGVSFLPIDAHSGAFGGDVAGRQALLVSPEQVTHYLEAVDRLEDAGTLRDGFVLESAAKLRSLAAHFEASAGRAGFVRPACDAPEWSLVVESDGSVRPCFFQDAFGSAREGLGALWSGEGRRAAVSFIRGKNETCAACVCPKKGAPQMPMRRFA